MASEAAGGGDANAEPDKPDFGSEKQRRVRFSTKEKVRSDCVFGCHHFYDS